MDTKKIGAFLKQCRKEKNLTQEQLAEKFGVSARTVSRWETGINMPDLSVLVQLAEYYDVEMGELLDGERSQTMNNVCDWCVSDYYSDAINGGYSFGFGRDSNCLSRRNPICGYYGV